MEIQQNCLKQVQRLNRNKVLAGTTCNLLVGCWGAVLVVICVTIKLQIITPTVCHNMGETGGNGWSSYVALELCTDISAQDGT